MIFEKYSYKTKFKALLVIFLLLGITAYKRSFSSLIGIIKENKSLSLKMNDVNSQSANIKVLSTELSSIDKVIGKGGLNKEKIQQNIINFVTQNKHNASIYDLQSIHEFSDENYTIYTNQLDVTGNLNNLLLLSYEFEKKFNFSRLVSINFYTVKKNNNPDALHLKMIFQNYENNK